jgi:Domain of unknown function (DUF1905)/Bacteriocin-protection, YdeI or OmpD-Associated
MQYIIQKSKAQMHTIHIEESVANELMQHNNKRVLCMINDTEALHCAILKTKEGQHYVIISSTVCNKMKLKVGSNIRVQILQDESEQQFEMPIELDEVLNSDDKARKIFNSLTLGNQRGLMHLVAMPKSADKKIERALIIAEKLKVGISQPRLILQKNNS